MNLDFWGLIAILIVLLLLLTFKSVHGEGLYVVTTPQDMIKLLNWDSEQLNMHTVFRCKDFKAKNPIIEIHSPYSKKGLKMFKEATRLMMHEVSVMWFRLTGSDEVRVFEVGGSLEDLEDDNIVYILKKGELVEPGLVL